MFLFAVPGLLAGFGSGALGENLSVVGYSGSEWVWVYVGGEKKQGKRVCRVSGYAGWIRY